MTGNFDLEGCIEAGGDVWCCPSGLSTRIVRVPSGKARVMQPLVERGTPVRARSHLMTLTAANSRRRVWGRSES